ncbi:MAG: NAAT family transporter [Methanobacteriota archaeon]|nr:MAG: NAAT family transporter [Euryarchaeota archaeon]
MVDLAYGLTAMASIFAIVDPIGAVPFFAALTEDYSPKDKQAVIQRSCAVALVVLLIFGLVGQWIFLAFSITIPAFQIAGGLLLFSVGFEMLHGERPRTKATEKEHAEALERQAVGVVPLGIPLLAGPGAISTVMVYISQESAAPLDKMFVFAGILVSILASYAAFQYADMIFKRIGRTGTLAISRILGLLLAAIAVQFVINGAVGAARLNGLLPP